MATIKEDYVSFEVAKLLKEKGFDIPCGSYFVIGENKKDKTKARFNTSSIISNRNGYKSELLDHEYISCPTQQMAMKWLREDKKILISIFCHIDKGYWFCIQHFIDSPYKFATSESIHRKEEILGKIQYYDTYEEACEEAIKYCLEKLI